MNKTLKKVIFDYSLLKERLYVVVEDTHPNNLLLSYGIASSKQWESNGAIPCEDALGLLQTEKLCCYCLADGHWGNYAAITAVKTTLAQISSTSLIELPISEVWKTVLTAVQNEILLGKRAETTLLIGIIFKENPTILYWCSFGDSYIFEIDSSLKLVQLNELRNIWLGPRVSRDDINTYLQYGFIDIGESRGFFFASDGIFDETIERKKSALKHLYEKILRTSDKQEHISEKIIKLILDAEGKDDIACIIGLSNPSTPH